MQLRPYQQKVVDEIGKENALIKMPTGSGKTFVAAEFVLRGIISSKNRQYEYDAQTTTAALFLVPTCDLVLQQSRALKHWIGDYEVAEYFGGQSIPTSNFDVLVSTPQAFLTLQQTEVSSRFSWSNYFAVVFDEVHHVLKDHPYRIIAHGIKKWEKDRSQRIQVIGLSASLTYAVEQKAVEQALSNLCHDLSVTRMISPSDEELLKSGYIPMDDNIETMKKPWQVPEGVIPESERQPHLMHERFFQRIKSNTTTPFAAKIYQVVCDIESEILACESKHDANEPFKSPLNLIKLSSWEDYAYRMKNQSITGSAMQSLFQFLEIWFVALRMIVQSWEEEEQLVLQWLLINEGFHKQGWFSMKLECSLNTVERLCRCRTVQSDKLHSLTKNLIEKRKLKGLSFRCIVFVQQRISAYVLSQYLNNHQSCNEHGLRVGYVCARKSRITPSIRVRSEEATTCINSFRDGTINIIVATSVIEEGFDVPEANVIISYDYIKDTVELSQRFGRGRQKDSSLTLMSERRDRPLSALKDVKTRQESIIKEFDPSKNQKISMARKQSQVDRERASASILRDKIRCEKSPLEVLNMYSAKTKAVSKLESMELGPDKVFRCEWSYSSIFKTVNGSGGGTSKKKAQHMAALDILNKLRDMDITSG